MFSWDILWRIMKKHLGKYTVKSLYRSNVLSLHIETDCHLQDCCRKGIWESRLVDEGLDPCKTYLREDLSHLKKEVIDITICWHFHILCYRLPWTRSKPTQYSICKSGILKSDKWAVPACRRPFSLSSFLQRWEHLHYNLGASWLPCMKNHFSVVTMILFTMCVHLAKEIVITFS